ncbi:hypothetical protein ACFPM0_32825 [Pseudonocardia sulfidoxydans]|uniref:hypothetical protein n=1 Tax=Pseudonocardia sulfidoxydans TaxID=54011 RepID=UPI00360FF1DC
MAPGPYTIKGFGSGIASGVDGRSASSRTSPHHPDGHGHPHRTSLGSKVRLIATGRGAECACPQREGRRAGPVRGVHRCELGGAGEPVVTVARPRRGRRSGPWRHDSPDVLPRTRRADGGVRRRGATRGVKPCAGASCGGRRGAVR